LRGGDFMGGQCIAEGMEAYLRIFHGDYNYLFFATESTEITEIKRQFFQPLP
jgi:hypothetical protein